MIFSLDILHNLPICPNLCQHFNPTIQTSTWYPRRRHWLRLKMLTFLYSRRKYDWNLSIHKTVGEIYPDCDGSDTIYIDVLEW